MGATDSNTDKEKKFNLRALMLRSSCTMASRAPAVSLGSEQPDLLHDMDAPCPTFRSGVYRCRTAAIDLAEEQNRD